jgi:hypothetical protein
MNAKLKKFVDIVDVACCGRCEKCVTVPEAPTQTPVWAQLAGVARLMEEMDRERPVSRVPWGMERLLESYEAARQSLLVELQRPHAGPRPLECAWALHRADLGADYLRRRVKLGETRGAGMWVTADILGRDSHTCDRWPLRCGHCARSGLYITDAEARTFGDGAHWKVYLRILGATEAEDDSHGDRHLGTHARLLAGDETFEIPIRWDGSSGGRDA